MEKKIFKPTYKNACINTFIFFSIIVSLIFLSFGILTTIDKIEIQENGKSILEGIYNCFNNSLDHSNFENIIQYKGFNELWLSYKWTGNSESGMSFFFTVTDKNIWMMTYVMIGIGALILFINFIMLIEVNKKYNIDLEKTKFYKFKVFKGFYIFLSIFLGILGLIVFIWSNLALAPQIFGSISWITPAPKEIATELNEIANNNVSDNFKWLKIDLFTDKYNSTDFFQQYKTGNKNAVAQILLVPLCPAILIIFLGILNFILLIVASIKFNRAFVSLKANTNTKNKNKNENSIYEEAGTQLKKDEEFENNYEDEDLDDSDDLEGLTEEYSQTRVGELEMTNDNRQVSNEHYKADNHHETNVNSNFVVDNRESLQRDINNALRLFSNKNSSNNKTYSELVNLNNQVKNNYDLNKAENYIDRFKKDLTITDKAFVKMFSDFIENSQVYLKNAYVLRGLFSKYHNYANSGDLINAEIIIEQLYIYAMLNLSMLAKVGYCLKYKINKFFNNVATETNFENLLENAKAARDFIKYRNICIAVLKKISPISEKITALLNATIKSNNFYN